MGISNLLKLRLIIFVNAEAQPVPQATIAAARTGEEPDCLVLEHSYIFLILWSSDMTSYRGCLEVRRASKIPGQSAVCLLLCSRSLSWSLLFSTREVAMSTIWKHEIISLRQPSSSPAETSFLALLTSFTSQGATSKGTRPDNRKNHPEETISEWERRLAVDF